MSFVTRTRTSGSTRTQASSSTSCDPPAVEEGSSEPPTITQRLWVLVGVVGSGKSTLADAVCTQIPNWTRVCQDELGDRKACEEATLQAFAEGKHVVVDRQNFNVSQRRVWLDLARAASPNITVTALVFSLSDEECRRRLTLRQDHPTVASPEKALELHDRFSDLFEDVSVAEGFDQIYFLPADLPLVMDVGFILRLIAQVDASPKLARPNPWTLSRGRGRGARGRGYERGRGSSEGRPRGHAGSSFRGRGGHTAVAQGGNRFNALARPPTDQTSASPWSQLGRGATLASSSGTSSTPQQQSHHQQHQPSEAQTIRSQMAQAAEARQRRAMQQPQPQPQAHLQSQIPVSESHSPSHAETTPQSSRPSQVQSPRRSPPPTKRVVIDLSTDD